MPESSYSLIFYSRNRLQLFLMVGMLLIHLQNGVAVEQKERKSVEIQLHLKSHKNSNFASELEEGHLVNTKFVSGWNRAPNVATRVVGVTAPDLADTIWIFSMNKTIKL
eukprot:Platyproteum_vivax@DN357_c0_g1_i1.p1